jgi:hypothetical protein
MDIEAIILLSNYFITVILCYILTRVNYSKGGCAEHDTINGADVFLCLCPYVNDLWLIQLTFYLIRHKIRRSGKELPTLEQIFGVKK